MNTARIIELFKHPALLDRETLYELRTLLDRYPYFSAARILYLYNLHLLDDRTFHAELSRTAFSINDRSLLFREIEAPRYAPDSFRKPQPAVESGSAFPKKGQRFSGKGAALLPETPAASPDRGSRTIDLINRFLAQQPDSSHTPLGYEGIAEQSPLLSPGGETGEGLLPREEPPAGAETAAAGGEADVKEAEHGAVPEAASEPVPDGKQEPPTPLEGEASEALDESYFTETLAKIYVKQGRYEKALEIIKAISLKNPKKSAYFADQIRFLRKLIINSSK